MRKTVTGIFAFIVTLFGGMIAYHYINQDDMIFRPLPLQKEHEFTFKSNYEEVYLPVSNGNIHGIYFKAENPKGVVLFLHGRGKNISFWANRADFFLEKHLDVFMIDYRGFGKSSPGFKESWLLEDALAGYDYLLSKFPEQKIHVFGNSLGTAMATWVAAHRNPNQLILESPYYSLLAAAAYTKPYLPYWAIRGILKYPLQTHKWITKVTAPIYIFHGKDDTIVPFVQSELLYQKVKKYNEKVEFIPLENWGHSHVEKHADYQARIKEIL